MGGLDEFDDATFTVKLLEEDVDGSEGAALGAEAALGTTEAAATC